MFLSDTALWNSHRILPLDIVENQLLTNISLFIASSLNEI